MTVCVGGVVRMTFPLKEKIEGKKMHVATNFMGFTISGRGGVNHGATATTFGHRDAMAGRSLNDALTLSSKAGKVISGAENKIASLDPANARDAIRIARLEDKIMQVLEKLIAKGVEQGQFREGIDPLSLHWMISAFAIFNVVNDYTFSYLFPTPGTPQEVQAQRRALATEAVLRWCSV